MRALLLTADRYPPERSDVKVLLAGELVQRGHRLDWIMQSRAPLARATCLETAAGTVLLGATDTGRRRWQRLRKHIRAIANESRVFSRLRRERYDFVLVRDKVIAAGLARLASWRSRTPCFFWLSFPFPENSLHQAREGIARYPWLYRLRGHVQGFLLYRVLLPRMDHVFVTSEQMRRDLVAYGLDAGAITAIPMGVDTGAMDVACADPLPGERYTCVYLGEMARARGLDFLLRAFRILHACQPQARLLMVGGCENPDDLQWLQQQAAALGIAEAVEFTGRLPQREAWRQVTRARVAFSPFKPSPVLNSASPTKLVEYLYLGVPTVANTQPDQQYVLDGSGAGRLVPWHEQAFAEAALELLALEDAAWQTLRQAGRTWVAARRSYGVLGARLEEACRQQLEAARA